jgi:manganese oxidase
MTLQNKAFVYAASALAALVFSLPGAAQAQPAANVIQANSNQLAAGTLTGNTLSLALEIREGEWFPESDSGPSMKVFAFSEQGKSPQIPGPLIRVREGMEIHATVHNFLPIAVTLHGLHARPGKLEDVLQIAPEETRDIPFDAGVPGAYYYWASAGGPVWNGRQVKEDSQLTGAFIVDPAAGSPPDRVFVIGMWRDQPAPDKSLDIPVINGKSWPYTERLTYSIGDQVRWRWLNPTSLAHPMHMHGSYFRVDSLGDGERDTSLATPMQLTVVTQFMPVGGTMTTLWIPQTAGHWLFHCHVLAHISPEIMMLDRATSLSSENHADHTEHKMTGLVLGLNVLPSSTQASALKPFKPRRKLELIVARSPEGGHTTQGYRLVGKGIPAAPPTCPGPPLVLTQGEPVAVRVTNQLNEPTAVHWHGIELESFYDGVPGWSGNDTSTASMIEPGQSFEVHMTPPRAGTFIYHTHMKDLAQLTSGLYGPIVVMPPSQKFDPQTDKIFHLHPLWKASRRRHAHQRRKRLASCRVARRSLLPPTINRHRRE